MSQASLSKQQPDNELSTAISGNSADSHPVNLAKAQPPSWVVGRNAKSGSFLEKRAALKVS